MAENVTPMTKDSGIQIDIRKGSDTTTVNHCSIMANLKDWRDRLFGLLRSVLFYGYGLFTLLLYAFLAVRRGTFFKRSTKKEELELLIAQDRLWNLSKDYFGLSHHFLTLRNGFKFHYLSNHSDDGASDSTSNSKPLVLFIHGFPDSWAIWRSIVSSESLRNSAILVAVDLPGFGGSDRLDKYTATNVLEGLTEFVFAVRVKYGVDTETGDGQQKKVVVVGHDWGCVLAMRLAAEAPQLADRFILTNGPLPSLVVSNYRRRLSSSWKMIKTSGRFPLRSRSSTIFKAIKTLIPIFRQVILSGYIFAFQLPMPFVRYLGYGGNYSFLKGVHQASCGGDDILPIDAAECMASTLGPSVAECKTRTKSGDAYPESTQNNRSAATFEHMTSYYRDGVVRSRWEKSIETIAHLHSLDHGIDSRRSSSGAGVFDDGPEGLLKANSTIIWGKADIALEPHLCLDGISDYLVFNSQVVVLPRSGHFTPVERKSRLALEKAVEWAVKGEKEDIGAVMRACYSDSILAVRR